MSCKKTTNKIVILTFLYTHLFCVLSHYFLFFSFCYQVLNNTSSMLSNMSKSFSMENLQLPMAISTITSPPHTATDEVMSSCSSSSCSPSPTISESLQYSDKHYYDYHREKPHSLPSSSLTSPQREYHPYLHNSKPTALPTSPSLSITTPLSLQERRERNKAASAKYRAKKNLQHGEMKSVIASLTRENELLQRQLEHIKQENNQLKATCDRIRGKMMAEKMLKRMMGDDKRKVRELKAALHLKNSDDKDENMGL